MSTVTKSAADWVGSVGTSVLAWWIPTGAIIAALFAPAHMRAVVWTAALLWMGTACILNSRRCGRTHCRYTGPYYLAMIAPVILLVSGLFTLHFYAWLALAALIIFGGWIIWWMTERAWGKFS
ncbi:hypothetical protein [Bradyrhizobium paxllaeri]|uniref:hypothetical protein n=1 Tax=Bradyrhizobium paxllaeri TaxID=190148 RepID=UPI000810EADA|nr:hypothetical protein [Bradyrhizobium paxllaeri]